ncbi:RHS repeat-associated core domain-containing protein [Mesorhizobium sp. MSK_1335]|uniref:RHS repeat-associated core domain-containing protein n=1 Tax=Mesorhizobium montanum TaxID=3072323 RepID=A0ABU4ZPE0_9HYPH|nr:RHS repeat-associated core domain-containing protein [Mesorhizobium sp. MSK_1335]MDX8525898.1 RHS repeat-associated core domain-containing protein [Mesorhizobium sp. MSK_1335]
MNNGWSRFIGAFPDVGSGPGTKACSWTSFQYLCTQETGHYTLSCGTSLPGLVFFGCNSGYDQTPDGRCILNNPPQRPRCETVGNPIDVSSGAKLLSATDFATADGRFRIGRNYNSFQGGRTFSQRSLPLGSAVGWQFNFEMELQLGSFSGSPSSPTGNVTLITPDGSGYDFVLQANGSWEPRAASGAVSRNYRLEFVGSLPGNLGTIKNTSSQWRVIGPDDRTWTLQTFSDVNASPASYRAGRPTSIQDRDGYSQAFSYATDGSLSSITDAFGRAATFAWSNFYISTLPNIAGSLPFPEAVREITFPDGTKAAYTYDPPASLSVPSTSRIQRLVKVEWKDVSGTVVDSSSYHYEDTNFTTFLTGITDHRGIRTATYTYDSGGHAVSTEGANGANKFTVVYGTSGSQFTRSVTNVLGRTDVYKYDKVGGSSWDIRFAGVDGQATTNCPASANAVTYDGNGYVASRTDEEGRVTAYVNDSRGRPTQITEAYGLPAARQTTITWHPTFNAPQQVIKPGLTVDYTYNTAGQLTGLTQTDTTSQTVPYSTNGQTRSWAYTYTTSGLVSSVDGPLAGTGDTVSYTYDSSGYLATITDEAGNVTTVNTVDGRGQPTRTTDSNGLVTDIAYDARGRLLTTTADPTDAAALTSVTYDAAGNATKITQPDGSYLTFAYDNSNRVTLITNTNGDTAAYTYDAMGNVLTQQLSNSYPELFFSWQRTFDELGRAITLTGAGPASWAYGYDKVGNLKTVTDPNANTMTNSWDALDRLLSFTDERSDATSWTYGATEQPLTAKDPRNVTTGYVRNGWGETIQEASPDIGSSVYLRDQNGRITKKTDARGVVANYTYDNAGRIATVAYPAEPTSNVTYAYDSVAGGNFGKGRLTGVTDAAGTVAYAYDILGRVTSETRVIDGQTYVVGYERDAAGNVVAMTYPSGRRVTFDRDADGKINVVKQTPLGGAPAYLTFYVGRTPFGPRLGITYANDTREARRYDQDGRLTNLELLIDSTTVNIIDWNYHYDDKRNLTAINDFQNAANNETYTYTASGFLASATGSWGALTYQTDGVGNITQRTVTVGGVTSVDTYSLQADSNRLTGIVTGVTPSRSFQSDFAGNTTQDVTVSPALTKDYIWNNAGQLKEAKVGGVSKGTYVYDYLSRLVSRTLPAFSTIHTVHDLDGNVIAEYSSTGTLLREYVWLEERPLAVIDSTVSPAATYWVQTDQLERPVMMTDINSAIVWQASYLPYGEVRTITGSATLDQRFPGQWFQMETGLSYNWHRHYDPSLGRYLQPDPLGMPDGPSRWAYVSNSPLMGVDPSGQYEEDEPWKLAKPPGDFGGGGGYYGGWWANGPNGPGLGRILLGLMGFGLDDPQPDPAPLPQPPRPAPAPLPGPQYCTPDMPPVYDPPSAPRGYCSCNCRVTAGRDEPNAGEARYAKMTLPDNPGCRATAIEACRVAKKRLGGKSFHHQEPICRYEKGKPFAPYRG